MNPASLYTFPFIASLGGLLALDSVFFLQIQISRPLIAAVMIASLMGDFTHGLWVGLPIELIWIAILPLGNFIPPDVTIVSIVAVFLSISGAQAAGIDPKFSAALALFISLPFGPLLKTIDMRFRSLASGWTHTLENSIQKENTKKLSQIILLSLFLQWAKNTALIVLLIALLLPLHGILSNFSFLHGVLVRWLGFLPLLGIVAILKEYKIAKHAPYYLLGLLGGFLFLAGKFI